jgi:hypothetical protein
MHDFLPEYRLNATTWVYLSSLITIAVFFKFRRFWSVRNLDIVGLLAFAPGLLLVAHGMGLTSVLADTCARCGYAIAPEPSPRLAQIGYVWIFIVGGFFLVRLLLDPLMVRRPLLEPNLSASGLTFATAALLVFLLSNVVTLKQTESDLAGGRQMDELLSGMDSKDIRQQLVQRGPGHPLFFIFSSFSEKEAAPSDGAVGEPWRRGLVRAVATRVTVIFAHLVLIAGLVLVGYRHFDNTHTGVAAAALYLLLPYTAEMTPRVDHVVPAALLVWAVQTYRRPMIAGIFLGLAGGLIYYPLFLLPLWCSFYWRRGLVRFACGVLLALLVLVVSLLITSGSFGFFVFQLRQMFGITPPLWHGLEGFWQYHAQVFRIPVLVAFVVLAISLALWPAQKNLGTLLSCSAAVMLGAQFWKAFEGGLYLAWYVPLLILTVFRPNLEDRVALSTISEGWGRRRKGGG